MGIGQDRAVVLREPCLLAIVLCPLIFGISEVVYQDLQLIGLDIAFVDDNSIVAHVVGDKEVEFEGKKWRLSPLTKEIQTRRGVAKPSGSYHGAAYWEYDGVRLYDIIWG